MRIYKIASPLPLEAIPVEHGEDLIDNVLTKEMIAELDAKYRLKEHLGGGMWGVAFLTHDDKVLKLTTDSLEIQAAEEIQNVPYGPFAKIYEIGTISNEKTGGEVNYILKERVTPISGKLLEIFDDMAWGRGTSMQADVEALRISNPAEVEKIEDYFGDVEQYSLDDTIRSDNVGLDSNGNIVSFDARINRGMR